MIVSSTPSGRTSGSATASIVCRPHSLNISKTTWPIKVEFHMEPLWNWGKGLFKWSRSHDQGGRPSMVKNLKIFFSGTKRSMTLKLGMQHRVLEYYQVCSNDDPGFTLTYFRARSNLVPYAFE